MAEIRPVTVWYSIRNCGDGSAVLGYFMSEWAAKEDQLHMLEGWGEDCIGSIETYEGSKTHKRALANEGAYGAPPQDR